MVAEDPDVVTAKQYLEGLVRPLVKELSYTVYKNPVTGCVEVSAKVKPHKCCEFIPITFTVPK